MPDAVGYRVSFDAYGSGPQPGAEALASLRRAAEDTALARGFVLEEVTLLTPQSSRGGRTGKLWGLCQGKARITVTFRELPTTSERLSLADDIIRRATREHGDPVLAYALEDE